LLNDGKNRFRAGIARPKSIFSIFATYSPQIWVFILLETGEPENPIENKNMLTTLILNGNEVPAHLYTSLGALITGCFGGMKLKDLPPATQRAVLLQGGQVIAHAAVQARVFPMTAGPLPGFILGCVCTHPDARQKGIGTAITQSLLAKLDIRLEQFIVLNCGESVTGFYAKMGFVRVAEQAVYTRNGQREVDSDPVMGMGISPSFDVRLLRYDPFPLGEDF
jgi:predicted GNAT family N-acyltransferase